MTFAASSCPVLPPHFSPSHAAAARSASRAAGARHLRPRATVARTPLLGLARSEHPRGRRHPSVAASPALVRTACLRVGPELFPAAAPGSLAGTARRGCDHLAGYYHARRPQRADIGDAGWCRGDSGDAGRGIGDRRRDDSSRGQKGLAHVPAQLPQTQAQARLYEVRRCTLVRPALLRPTSLPTPAPAHTTPRPDACVWRRRNSYKAGKNILARRRKKGRWQLSVT